MRHLQFSERLTIMLNQCDWFVHKMDLAYDFNCNITRHFTLVEGRTKVTYKHTNKKTGEVKDCGNNYYLYSFSSPFRARIYDKKEELLVKQGMQIEDENLMRFEITVKPPITKQSPLHYKDFRYIGQCLDKFSGRFIPRLHDLKGKIRRENLDLLYTIMRRREKNRLRSESKELKVTSHH